MTAILAMTQKREWSSKPVTSITWVPSTDHNDPMI
jgi:hypothetical protein